MSELHLLTPWTAEIILALAPGEPARFNRLAEAIPGISDRMLGLRLRELTAAGWVSRRPIWVEGKLLRGARRGGVGYALTPAGERLVEPLRALRAAS